RLRRLEEIRRHQEVRGAWRVAGRTLPRGLGLAFDGKVDGHRHASERRKVDAGGRLNAGNLLEPLEYAIEQLRRHRAHLEPGRSVDQADLPEELIGRQ